MSLEDVHDSARKVIGLMIFISLYKKYGSDNVLETLSSFHFVVMLVIPFLPAAVLSAISARHERQYIKIKKENG
jgi:Na+/proline symporter